MNYSHPNTPPPAHTLDRAWWALVRFGFRLLYNEMAWTYDVVSWIVSLGQWRRWQRAAIPHLNTPPGARILELAHGTGNLAIDLRANGYRAINLDRSPAMGRIAQYKLRRWGFRAPLVRAQAQALPFPADRFAAVISTFPTEFIIDPATLTGIHRVLQPGGRLVVVINGLLTDGTAARALEFAYRVTGQRGPWPVGVEDRLKHTGFDARVISEELPRSTVLILIAEKVADPPRI